MDVLEKFEVVERVVEVTQPKRTIEEEFIYLGNIPTKLTERKSFLELKNDLRRFLSEINCSAIINFRNADYLRGTVENKKLYREVYQNLKQSSGLLSLSNVSFSIDIDLSSKRITFRGKTTSSYRELKELKVACREIVRKMDIPKISGKNNMWSSFELGMSLVKKNKNKIEDNRSRNENANVSY